MRSHPYLLSALALLCLGLPLGYFASAGVRARRLSPESFRIRPETTRVNLDSMQPFSRKPFGLLLSNPTPARAFIRSVSSSCGCVTAKTVNPAIPGGKSVKLEGSFQLTRRKGEAKYHLGVKYGFAPKYNIPDKIVGIEIVAQAAEQHLQTSPPAIHAAYPEGETSASLTFKIHAKDAEEFRIVGISGSTNLLSAFYGKAAASSHTITASIDTRDLLETVNGSLTVLTDHPRQDRFIVPLLLEKKSIMSALPSAIVVGTHEQFPELTITHRDGKKFQIKDVSFSGKALTASWDREFRLAHVLRLSSKGDGAAYFKEITTIHAEDGAALAIPVIRLSP